MKPDSQCLAERANILLVDDQKVTGLLLAKMLQDEPDLNLYTCSDPQQAVILAHNIAPSVVLLDLVMPHVDGLTLLKTFREDRYFEHLPIIMLSTEEDPIIKAKAFEEGANDYLLKLPDQVEMLARLRYHAENHCTWMATEKAKLALKNSERRFRMVTHSVHDGIVTTRHDGSITFLNPAVMSMFGFRESELLHKSVTFLVMEHDHEPFYEHIQRLNSQELDSPGHSSFELLARRKDGSTFPMEISVSTMQGVQESFVLVLRDITERKKTEEKIYYQANFDALTSLPNRPHFMDILHREIMLCQREETALALLFIDLDRFKWVNDTWGHAAGDDLLKECSHRLKKCVRKTDTVARLAGDEFTAILHGVNNHDFAEKIARKMLRQLNTHFILEGEEVQISGSIGITLFPHDAPNMDTLLRNADMAMYVAKNSGRNNLWFFSPEETAKETEHDS